MRSLAGRYLPASAFALLMYSGTFALAQGALQPIRIDSSLAQRERDVQLEVYLNGEATGLIVAFKFHPKTNSLTVRRSELLNAGIKLPKASESDAIVQVDTLGLPFNYDEAQQKIFFTVRKEQRLPRNYNAAPVSHDRIPSTIDPGLILNYSLFGGSFKESYNSRIKFSGANVTLDARAFSRFGVLRQTAIAGTTLYKSGTNILRLESTYSFSLPETTVTGNAGDIVTGALRWTRPIRIGGVQIKRDFTLRSDVVHQPIPIISGTAAVPSTVDVYVNGLRSYSQTVNSGPFRISNLADLAGGGTARVIVRDASGRQVEQRLQLNESALLLRPGLYDFSVEAGWARRNFGVLSNDYDKRFLGSATLRQGVHPRITLEAHVEGGAGLINGGAGIVAGLGVFGKLQLALAASRRQNADIGYQIYGDWHKRFKWLTIGVSGQHTFGNYEDLASVTAKFTPLQQVNFRIDGLTLPGTSVSTSFRPPRTLARISFGLPLRFDKGSLAANFIYSKTFEGTHSKTVSLSYNRPLPYRASLFVTAFADVGSNRNIGIYAGMNFPLFGGIYGTTSLSRYSDRIAGSFEARKVQPLENNSYGWSLRAVHGQQPLQAASASYRSAYGQAGVAIQKQDKYLSGTATFDGSIAVMRRAVVLGNKVNSSFAVVSTGKSGIPVTVDNRTVGKTNMFGKLLLPNLRPYQRNTIAIDTTRLPANFDAGNTNRVISPRHMSGVHVDYSKNTASNSAVIVFRSPTGKYIPPGSRGKMHTGQKFTVGYDGRAYIRDLKSSNSVVIDLGTKDCSAKFNYRRQGNQQVQIDNITCE